VPLRWRTSRDLSGPLLAGEWPRWRTSFGGPFVGLFEMAVLSCTNLPHLCLSFHWAGQERGETRPRPVPTSRSSAGYSVSSSTAARRTRPKRAAAAQHWERCISSRGQYPGRPHAPCLLGRCAQGRRTHQITRIAGRRPGAKWPGATPECRLMAVAATITCLVHPAVCEDFR